GSESSRAERTVERASGFSASAQVLVLVRDPTQARLRDTAAAIRSEPAFPLVAPPLRSRDGSEALLAAYADADRPAEAWRAAAARVERRLAPRQGILVGGPALATRQVNDRVQHDLTRAEAIAFPILFVLALFVFRGVVAALLPLLCGALTILGALLMLRILDALTPVSSYALNIVTGAGLGLGIDYSLLLVSRYREELRRLGPGPEAVRETLRTAGRTVVFSAITVAAAIATLAVFPLGFLRSMGIAGGFVAPLAGLVSLTVLPALFLLLGERVNALAVRRVRERDEGGWYRLAHGIMRRPLPVAVASAVLLVVLGLPFAGIRFTGVDATVLPPGTASRVVDEAVRHDFPPRALSTGYAVVHGDPAALAARVRTLPEAEVVSPPRRLAPNTYELRFSSGRDFLDARSQRLVERLRALPGPHLVGGSAAQFLDQKHALGSRLPLAIALICAITFVLLGAATRSLVLPLKALVMNFLTLAAAFGILVFVFQDGRLEGLLGYSSQGALELTQPVLLFAIAFGLSTDYGVFLLTRIREAWDAGLENREAVAVGLERTGRIVTAAALLFCIAVGSFATSQIVFVKEVGIGIALAVLIDASIVRALLVPSLMALLGRWNWWPTARARASARPRPGRQA
ncbi:MAG TPA: MMPL family transporter, partial [Gaiellaceae bacterium]|nr:MMPL family transporter [Gaiellaceae bacterium]